MTPRSTTRKCFGFGAILLAAGLLVSIALPIQPAAQQITPAMKKLAAEAQAKGVLQLSYGGNALGGGPGSKKYEKGFNKYFGTSIKFHYTPGRGFFAQAAKSAQLLAAGQPAFTDTLISGDSGLPFLKGKKVTQAVDWSALLPTVPKDVQKKIIAPDRSMLTFITQGPTIVYNTKFVKPPHVPKTLADLLDPRWKGKIGSTPYAAGFGNLSAHPGWNEERIMNYSRKLANNLGGLMRCGEYDRITSGEFWIFALACEPGRGIESKEQGATINQVIPLDVPTITHWHFGVPKNSVHPAAGKLFIAWLLTPEGQRLTYENQRSDLYYLKGSRTAKVIAAAKRNGAKFQDMTIARVLEMKSLNKVGRAVAKMFRESRPKKK